MTTEVVSPLRQRMIQDMNARKLCPPRSGATSEAASSSTLSRHGHGRGHPSLPTAPGRERRRAALYSQTEPAPLLLGQAPDVSHYR
jgi:hypothetical protein